MNPKYSKHFVNQEDVPAWWTEQDDKDVEEATIGQKPIIFTPDTEPVEDESVLDDE